MRLIAYISALMLLFTGCSKETAAPAQTIDTANAMTVNITIGEQTMTALLADNEATQALLATLAEGPVTVTASDYGGFEKVAPLPHPLPTANRRTTTQAGDIMLYQGSSIVFFYGSNTWSYTTIGHIEHASTQELKQFLLAGEGDASITLSLPPTPDDNQ